MSSWQEKVEVFTGLSISLQSHILSTLVALSVAFLMIFLIRRIIWRQTQDIRNRYTSYKIATYVVGFITMLVIGRIWFQGTQSLVTYFGLLSAGIAIALQDVISNVAGWLFIWFRRPFKVGDRVQVGDSVGDVIDIGILQFSLLEVGNWVDADQSTGRIVHVPNRDVVGKVTANYVSGFEYIWDEIQVLITFESNWKKAKGILTQIIEAKAESAVNRAKSSIRDSSRHYMIRYTVLTPKVFTDVKNSGVMLTMRYLCLPKRRRTSREQIWEAVLEEFAPHPDIDFAYPTQRMFRHNEEGKPIVNQSDDIAKTSNI